MNDNTKVLDQNPIPAPVANNVVQPQGSLNKEKVPIGQNLSEFVRPVGPETSPNLPSEVSESGVKVESNKPDLTPEHQELGVDHAGPHVPVSLSPSGKVSLPMSEDEIANQLKTGQDDDSGKWLAGLIQKVIRAMGL